MALAGGTEGAGSPLKCHTCLSWQAGRSTVALSAPQNVAGAGICCPRGADEVCQELMALGSQDAPLAHPRQGPGASIPLQGLPLFPRGASGSWELLLSILGAFQAHLGEGSRRAELWAQPGPRSRGCRWNIP